MWGFHGGDYEEWWRRRQVPPKRRFLQESHSVTTQKTPFFIWTTLAVTSILRSVRRLLVTVNVVLNPPILITLMIKALSSSETLSHTRTTRLNIPEFGIFQTERNSKIKIRLIVKFICIPESATVFRDTDHLVSLVHSGNSLLYTLDHASSGRHFRHVFMNFVRFQKWQGAFYLPLRVISDSLPGQG
jgi:hypothetical protein